MKKLITILILLFSITVYSQGVRTLEIQNVEEKENPSSDTKLMVWDSLDNREVKYIKLVDLPVGNDNLGNGIATSNVNLSNFNLTNANTIYSNSLKLGNNTSNAFNSLLQFDNSSTGIGNVFPVYINNIKSNTTTDPTGNFYGLINFTNENSSGGTQNVRGLFNRTQLNGSKTTDRTYGLFNETEIIDNGVDTSLLVYGLSNVVNAKGTNNHTVDFLLGTDEKLSITNPNGNYNNVYGHSIDIGIDNGTVGAIAGLRIDIDQVAANSDILDGSYLYFGTGIDLAEAIANDIKLIESDVDLPSTFAGTIEAKGLSITGGTSDEIMLRDGSFTSLSAIGSGGSIYNTNGNIPQNTVRNVALSNSSVLNFFTNAGGALSLQNNSLGSGFYLTYNNIDIDNDALQIYTLDTNKAEFKFKRGLKVELSDSSGNLITPEAGQALGVINTDGDVGYIDIPTTTINQVEISTNTYTLNEADVANMIPHFVTATGDVTITIPTMSLTDVTYFNIIKETAGTVTIIPASGVNPQQYDFRDTDLAQTLYSRTDDVWQLWRGNATVSAYTPPSGNYSFNNAVSTDDSNSNANWNGTSTFFANAIPSTDTGDSYSIGIETRTTSANDTASINHTLPTLAVGTEYRATIRYKNTKTVTAASNPFTNWTGVTNTTYPSTYSTGNWVEVDVIFTPTVAAPVMKIYPHNNSANRTDGDVLEISSINITVN